MSDLKRLIGFIDHTALDDGRERSAAEIVCAQAAAAAKAGTPVAAVCIWSDFIRPARTWLKGRGVPIATVVNFPDGDAPADAVHAETEKAITDGAEEIDVVIPFRRDPAAAGPIVAAARAACGGRIPLKVILETGQLGDRIAATARIAVANGADFLKTSTGKFQPGAEMPAVETLLSVIAEHRGRLLGLKVSGGVRTPDQASAYLQAAEKFMGQGWAKPATFRLGASGLLGVLSGAVASGTTSPSRY